MTVSLQILPRVGSKRCCEHGSPRQDPGRMLNRRDTNIFRAVYLHFLRVPNFAEIKLKT